MVQIKVLKCFLIFLLGCTVNIGEENKSLNKTYTCEILHYRNNRKLDSSKIEWINDSLTKFSFMKMVKGKWKKTINRDEIKTFDRENEKYFQDYLNIISYLDVNASSQTIDRLIEYSNFNSLRDTIIVKFENVNSGILINHLNLGTNINLDSSLFYTKNDLIKRIEFYFSDDSKEVLDFEYDNNLVTKFTKIFEIKWLNIKNTDTYHLNWELTPVPASL